MTDDRIGEFERNITPHIRRALGSNLTSEADLVAMAAALMRLAMSMLATAPVIDDARADEFMAISRDTFREFRREKGQ